MKIAIIGLGRMGMQIAKRLHNNGFEVAAWNRSEMPRKEFEESGGKTYENIDELLTFFGNESKVVWVMLPADTVEDFLFGSVDLIHKLSAGDYLIEGGNSFYKDSVRRAAEFEAKGIHFYDCGVSGGVWGERNGFALMTGGSKEHFSFIEPILKTLSSGENYGLVGKSGAGNFVKMVHNGIEYGMMEAIAEGYAVMKASPFELDLLQVTKVYQQGSVVKSWLIDLMRNIYEKEDIEGTVGLVRATGEGLWTVEAAKELGVDARVIEASLKVREESLDPKTHGDYRNKLLALLRNQFGGHAVDKK